MFKIKNRRHKPLYKKFIALRANVQNRRRLTLLKFKKQKWQRLISYIKRAQNRRKKKFKIYDLRRHYLPKFYNPFKQKYKSVLYNKKRISLFYGSYSERFIKKQVNIVVRNKKTLIKKNTHLFFLSLLEKRLDVVLYRAHFFPSTRNARQFILHKHVKVNGAKITDPNYSLQQGDLVEIHNKLHDLIYSNVAINYLWPLPPKHLQINYRTFEISFNNNIESQNLSMQYPFRPDIYLLLRYYR